MDSVGLSLLFALVSIVALAIVCCLIHYIAKARSRLRKRNQGEAKTGDTIDEPDIESLAASTRASVMSLASTPGVQEQGQVRAIVQTPEAVHFSNPFDKQQADPASKDMARVQKQLPAIRGNPAQAQASASNDKTWDVAFNPYKVRGFSLPTPDQAFISYPGWGHQPSKFRYVNLHAIEPTRPPRKLRIPSLR